MFGYFACFLLLGVSVSIEAVSVPACGKNEVLNTAAPRCTPQPTCQNPSPSSVHGCVEDYCEERCECKSGYIRDESLGGSCVPTSHCPCQQECGINEVLVECANYCIEERSCQNPNPVAIVHCKSKTISRCECDQSCGYIRDNCTGLCIKEEDCPCYECGQNEVYNECATCCDIEPTCDEPLPQVDPCCEPSPNPRCMCAPGYVRNHSGNCVCSTECPCNIPTHHHHHEPHHLPHIY